MDREGGPPVQRGGGSVQKEGRDLLTAFYAATSALKLYPLDNITVQQALDDLHRRMLVLAQREGRAELRVVGEFFFLNEVRLRLDLSNFSTFGSFARALRAHGVGAIEIGADVTRDEWAPFLSGILQEPDEEDPFDALLTRLAAAGTLHIDLTAETEVQRDEGQEPIEAKDAAKRTYVQSVRVAGEVMTDVRLGRAVNVRKVKRAVQGIVDQVLANEPSILTMTTLRDYDEYTFVHSVNVCILSVIIGQRIGLDKSSLYDLGLGALLHDIGKIRLDPEVINKTGELDDDEWKLLREHPAEGLLLLFGMHGFGDVPYRQMLMAYEHHMRIDLTGYPKNQRARDPGIFSKIVAVADAFDAGTSVRSYQFQPWAPDEVLKEMKDNPARGFDPLLVKVLINATGVFPVGTLVILDTFELAVVAETNPNIEKLHQPKVKVISDQMGMPLAVPVTVDLSEADPGTGRPLRSIIKTTDPQKYSIRVSDYLT